MNKYIRKINQAKGVILPKMYLDSLGLKEGTSVEISLSGEEIIIKRARPKYNLEDMLAQITPYNQHLEINFGPDVGEEIVEYKPEKNYADKKTAG